jgi:peptide deformylase
VMDGALPWHTGSMLLKIVQVGHPVLREGTRLLTAEEVKSAQVQQLIEWMRETMLDAPGVGLAAPQIGLPWRMAVIEDTVDAPEMDRKPVPFHVLINPTITTGSELVAHYEGCLSVGGFQARVPRAQTVTVEALDHHAKPITIEATGWYARILQHEIDHLDGMLYIDRMETRTFTTVDNAPLAAKQSDDQEV